MSITLPYASSYCDANKWTRRYQRNNKQSGLKNLRCFPFCSDIHKIRGFCGHGVIINISLKDQMMMDVSPDNIRCWAAFVRYDDPFHQFPNSSKYNNSSTYAQEEYDINVNQIISKDQVEKWARTSGNPFKPWYPGERLVDGEEEEEEDGDDDDDENSDSDMKDDDVNMKKEKAVVKKVKYIQTNPDVISFAFNKQKKGWHYGWTANKHTCDDPHILRTYVCAAQPGTNSLRCIARIDSPPFTIFCRRRQREHVADLPSQLRSLEHLQLRKKEYQSMMQKNPQLIQELYVNELAASLTKLAEGDANKPSQTSALLGSNSHSKNKKDKKMSDKPKKKKSAGNGNEIDEIFQREFVINDKGKRVVPSKDFGSMLNDIDSQRPKKRGRKSKKELEEIALAKQLALERLNASVAVDSQIYQSNDQQIARQQIQIQHPHQQQIQGTTPTFPVLENITAASSSPSMSGDSENDFFFTLADDFFLDGLTSFSIDELTGTAGNIAPATPVPPLATTVIATNANGASTGVVTTSTPVPSQTPTLGDGSVSLETMIFTIMSSLTRVHGNAANDGLSTSSAAIATTNNGNSGFSGERKAPTSPIPKFNSMTDLDEFTKNIADCLDTLISQESKYPLVSLGRNTSTTSNVDFINRPESRNSISSAVRNAYLDSILESLAATLLEETDFSEEISSALKSMKEKSSNEADKESMDESHARRAFVTVLEKQINKLLTRHSITIPDLYNMIIGSQEPADVADIASSAIDDDHPKSSQSSNKNEVKQSMDKYLKRYIEGQTKGSNVLLPSIHHSISYIGDKSSRQRLTEMLLEAVNETLFHSDLQYLSEPSLHPADVFQPTMDIGGKWRRPESTLKILEKLRERVGVSWLVRKMLKDMESTFEIDINPTRMAVFNKKKLLSSGFFDYTFDGKLRPFGLESPIPGEKSLSESLACAALNRKFGCIVFLQMYSETTRLVRATIRNVELNEIQSVVTIQARHNPQSPWQKQITANVRAVPLDDHEDGDEMADKITANESEMDTKVD